MSENTLFDRCRIATNFDGDTFVGFRINDDGVEIRFPLGFHYEDDTEEELRHDVLTLIQLIANTIGHETSTIKKEIDRRDNVSLPVQAFLFMIRDFLERGSYQETEVRYKDGKSGKVNWGRTIKNKKPVIQDNNVYYLNMVVRTTHPRENELISQIYQYCVYLSFQKVGWLFTSYMPQKPEIIPEKDLSKAILKDKLASTFSDRNRQLFINMLAVLDYLGENDTSHDYSYGTDRFEYVWEKMIDKVYGIKDKQQYFPVTEWHLPGQEPYDNSPLEPDSIMFCGQDIYILDAKYYKYGWTKRPGDLPQSSSINKQITYGEYLAALRSKEDRKDYQIYNAFLMPFDSNSTYWKEKGASTIINIGEAVSRWKNNKDHKYEKIQGILLDTKYLMNVVVECDKQEIKKLAEVISERFSSE